MGGGGSKNLHPPYASPGSQKKLRWIFSLNVFILRGLKKLRGGTMAVTKSQTRTYVGIDWDNDALVGDTVDIKATNLETGDVSTRDGVDNDGESFVTYPYGFSGTSHIEVSDAEGNVEEGDIDAS
jgi:hypothetical protein